MSDGAFRWRAFRLWRAFSRGPGEFVGDNFDQETDTGKVNHALGIGFDLGNALVGSRGEVGELPEQLLQVGDGLVVVGRESHLPQCGGPRFARRRCRSRTSSLTAGRRTRLGLWCRSTRTISARKLILDNETKYVQDDALFRGFAEPLPVRLVDEFRVGHAADVDVAG